MRSKPWTLTVDPAGNIIVAGPATPNDPSSTELYVAKLDNHGTVLWQQRLDRKCAELFESGGSVEADDPLRDSVSPLLIDAQTQAHEPHPRGGGSRFFGVALVAAGLSAVVAVGVASQDIRALRAFPPAAAAAAATKASTAELPRPTEEAEPPTSAPVITEHAVLAEVATSAPLEPAPPQLTTAELRSQTLAMLMAQQHADALILARAYVDAEPDHAFAYLCLGAALQDLGRMDEAREAYSECVREGKRGDISECRALGGRK